MSQYQFSFDRKKLVAVVAGLVFTGVLTFCCGVVTGIGLSMPAQRELAQLRGVPAGAGKAVRAPALPGVKLPVVPAAEIPGARGFTTGLTTPAAVPAVSNVAPAPQVTQPAVAPPVTNPAPAGSPPPPAASPDPLNQPFVLQLGAFREQKNAKQLQADLKLKGYPTTICNMMDEDQRTWHMVRFGGYKDLAAASHAASDFTGKEGIQALVRRSDSL